MYDWRHSSVLYWPKEPRLSLSHTHSLFLIPHSSFLTLKKEKHSPQIQQHHKIFIMTEVVSLMDIDDDNNKPNNNNNSNIKGKNVVVPGESKATPWVEKYRPQSLADVAAHRDIVDTSLVTLSLSLSFPRVSPCPCF